MSRRGKLFASMAFVLGVLLLGGGARVVLGWELDEWSLIYGACLGLSASIYGGVLAGD